MSERPATTSEREQYEERFRRAALPLLMLFSVVLFMTTEIWQVFANMNRGNLYAIALLLVLVGSLFLLVRLPREVEQLEKDVGSGPPLSRRQRINVGLVLFVSQSLQVLLVTAAVGAFSGLYYAIAVFTDYTYREEFLGEVTGEMRETFSERARYLDAFDGAKTV